MDKSHITSLINDFRAGYQIPPYIEHEQLERLAREAITFFRTLNPKMDTASEVTRGLILARMFYSYNHQEANFSLDYAHDIVTWQMAEVKAVE